MYLRVDVNIELEGCKCELIILDVVVLYHNSLGYVLNNKKAKCLRWSHGYIHPSAILEGMNSNSTMAFVLQIFFYPPHFKVATAGGFT